MYLEEVYTTSTGNNGTFLFYGVYIYFLSSVEIRNIF